ncbi:MAG: hypothetical protein HZA66_01520 [Rhodopseudomonas palustris]|uniref:HNH endonuclease 5 domain-containing protein n=1 Tax=Rhodopseudomonas palustris TaxID=1076 RepID=A0A933RT39_RHOPL|nr:hypothetical protein [Rhodopseudomonas palustris]
MVKHQNLPILPHHQPRRYGSSDRCIYCGSLDGLTKEHIIPYALGGTWIFPKASCKTCAKITAAFEGQFCRTILGPLRMLYNMPTRRPKERPRHLALKVKYPSSNDWEIAYVDRDICPFLIGLPLYPLPSALTGKQTNEVSGSATREFWLRGGGFWQDRDSHLQWLCNILGAVQVMPMAEVQTDPFCLTLAKIAHAFTAAELGNGGFKPFLTEMVRHRDVSRCSELIGGGRGNEMPSEAVHEIKFDEEAASKGLIVVFVRLLAVLGAPTYSVVSGTTN